MKIPLRLDFLTVYLHEADAPEHFTSEGEPEILQWMGACLTPLPVRQPSKTPSFYERPTFKVKTLKPVFAKTREEALEKIKKAVDDNFEGSKPLITSMDVCRFTRWVPEE